MRLAKTQQSGTCTFIRTTLHPTNAPHVQLPTASCHLAHSQPQRGLTAGGWKQVKNSYGTGTVDWRSVVTRKGQRSDGRFHSRPRNGSSLETGPPPSGQLTFSPLHLIHRMEKGLSPGARLERIAVRIRRWHHTSLPSGPPVDCNAARRSPSPPCHCSHPPTPLHLCLHYL